MFVFMLHFGAIVWVSGQLLWLREIDSDDAVTTGYSGDPKIILIAGLQMDSDGNGQFWSTRPTNAQFTIRIRNIYYLNMLDIQGI